MQSASILYGFLTRSLTRRFFKIACDYNLQAIGINVFPHCCVHIINGQSLNLFLKIGRKLHRVFGSSVRRQCLR